MWNCGNCGCQNIAPDVADCPQCFTPRAQGQPEPQPAQSKPARQPKAAKAADQSDQAAQEGGEQKSA